MDHLRLLTGCKYSFLDSIHNIACFKSWSQFPEDDLPGEQIHDAREISKALSGIGDATKGTRVIEDVPPVGGEDSIFREIFEKADNYTLNEEVYKKHIHERHGFNSRYNNKPRFNKGFNIKNGIESTLKGDNFVLRPNTGGRGGYIFEQTFNNPIGTSTKGKPLYTMKVVIDESGNVITAFPKK